MMDMNSVKQKETKKALNAVFVTVKVSGDDLPWSANNTFFHPAEQVGKWKKVRSPMNSGTCHPDANGNDSHLHGKRS
jgi:hypothetical protein